MTFQIIVQQILLIFENINMYISLLRSTHFWDLYLLHLILIYKKGKNSLLHAFIKTYTMSTHSFVSEKTRHLQD